MGDALQSLLSLIRSIADRVGSVLLAPVIGSITSLFRLARNSVTGAADAVSTVIDVAGQLINGENFITFLKNGLRLPHLFDVLVHLGGKTDAITALVQNPKILDEILNANTDDAKRLIDGLGQAINHFGSIADGVRVIEAAIDTKVDLASLKQLLELAIKNGWTVADNIIYFMKRIAGAIDNPGDGTPPTWSDSVAMLDTFHTVHQGTISYGSGSINNILAYVDISLPTLGTIRVNITEYDLGHHRNRHTFEEFALTPRRSFIGNDETSFFPIGHDPNQIVTHALLALQDPRVAQVIEDTLKTPDPRFAKVDDFTTINVYGWEYGLGIDVKDPSLPRLTMFYPDSGPGVRAVHKEVLRSISQILFPVYPIT